MDNRTIDEIRKNETVLINELKRKEDIINKAKDKIKILGRFDGKKCTRGFQMWSADFNQLLEILDNKGE